MVSSLVDGGANVTIVAGDVRATLEELPGSPDVHRGPWSPELLNGIGLIVVTGDEPGVEEAGEGVFPAAIEAAVRAARIPVAWASARAWPAEERPMRRRYEAQLRSSAVGPGTMECSPSVVANS